MDQAPGQDRKKVLWNRYISGDREAFGELYMYYHNDLTAYCLGRLKDFQLAENAASETLIKLLEHEQPAKIESFENWLFVVARNICNTIYTTANRRRQIIEDNPSLTQSDKVPEVEHNINMDGSKQLMKKVLNESEYRIWQLHQAGYHNDEIASKLSMHPKSVANQKSEARKKLKGAFSKT